MKTRRIIPAVTPVTASPRRAAVVTFLLLLATLNLQLSTILAQGTAFTYQGRLNDGANPASGNYDLRFTIYDALVGGSALAGPLTNAPTAVSNGLFTLTLDFGNAPFDGSARWLEIGVRTNGGGTFETLTPRQPLTPTPYAIMAGSASNLLGTLAAAQLSGTITANQLPPTLVTNNATDLNLSGAFSGNISGNGSGLTNVSGTLPWQIVSGTNQQAQPNTGYLLANSALTTVTLPVSPATGDVVRVSGLGAGGWKIAQNAGQSVLTANLAGNIGLVWTPHAVNGLLWNGVASSADGTKLVAAPNSTLIYTSTDSGATWTARDSGRQWRAAASSADGTKFVAVVGGGQIYTSTDSGVTWTARDTNRIWRSVASSADGAKLVASVNIGQIYTSTNSGETWTARDSSRQWNSVASSADGTKLVAVVSGGQIYTSTDSGVTWTARDSSRTWWSVASSADGAKLVAGVNGGQIYTSTDSGVTWTPRASSQVWWSVASSADGAKLAATVNGGQIYTSADSGVTWTARDSNRIWAGIASSADGGKLVAAVSQGQIYTSGPGSVSSTTTGTAGYLMGYQNCAIELQYLGNGQFLPISFVGLIQAF